MNINDEIYRKNLKKFNDRFPDMKESMNEKKDNIIVDVKEARNGQKSFVLNIEDANVHLHSKFNPQREAERWISDKNIKKEKIYILFGFGMIYHIKELIKKLDKTVKVLVIEPSISIFNEIIRNIDITDIIENKNIYVMLGKNNDILKQFLITKLSWKNYHLIEYYSFPVYKKFFQETEQNVKQVIEDHVFIRKIDRNTIIRFDREWQRNLLKNIRFATESHNINQLKGIFKNRPVVIVSAGPSLNKNVELLKTIKEKAVIICVDTALKVLLAKEIEPDFIITVDGGKLNLGHFDKLDYSDIPLIYIGTSHPEILKKHRGAKILADNNNGYIKELFKEFGKDVGIIKLGGSVACVAFNVAKKLGADPIIFIGQDLAYTNNKTHAKGTKYSTEISNIKTKYFKVEDINGDKILTGHDLYTFLKWFENEIANDKSERKYIDATEGGAKIEGTKVMTFKNTIEEYCKQNINITEKISNALDDSFKFNKQELKLLVKKLEEIYSNLEIIYKKSLDGINICNKIIESYENRKIENVNIKAKLNRLDDIDRYLKEKREEISMINYLIEPIVYRVFIENTLIDDEQDDISIMNRSRIFYKSLYESVEFTLPLIKETINNLIEQKNAKMI
ncbi:motility associated factor glycosyltransferase family protein [Clostridium sp. D2Q-14]|uniref:motility associated factor glycosyltransferase family protein n=1 Tax=Anaeromonas gelatinilytica TaxID=2683194 RepID=UPI00193BE35C|nr:6-hydroxymethylpterin diphosphokinase MptE-like protein [Anaeromonas gelatinilytica]MBS4535779.1 motility associated factor glycosyltransferase family protein [Anaeromonas gelatinilytica]